MINDALLAVIQLPFLGLIVALATLFPTIFGGAALFLKRWTAALSVASLLGLLSAIQMFFPTILGPLGITSRSGFWWLATGLSILGTLWAILRFRSASRRGFQDDYQPRFLDRIGLGILLLLGCTFLGWAIYQKESLLSYPWLDLIVFLVPVAICLIKSLIQYVRSCISLISLETVGLLVGIVVTSGAAIQLRPSLPPALQEPNPFYSEEPVWVFETSIPGEIVSTPVVTDDRVYVNVYHRPNPLTHFGKVYALDVSTGAILWESDNALNLLPMYSSLTLADGRLYFGEGYHTDRDSRMLCLDAATGRLLWEFQTRSHTESTPAVDENKVVFGAGDDGVYCLDAVTGKKLWQYEKDLHVDANPLVWMGKVYFGSGTSRKYQTNRIVCLNLQTGNEIWSERVEYAAWGSPAMDGGSVLFPIGNGTLSEDRPPIAGMLLSRDANSGVPRWERSFPNSLIATPVLDRDRIYIGCRDGNAYALYRQSGEIVWKQPLQSPVLASAVAGENILFLSSAGLLAQLAPKDGLPLGFIDFRVTSSFPNVHTIATPVRNRDGNRLFIATGLSLDPRATPTARLYCLGKVKQ
jgi:outer membrane protein assembly factor BamB